MDQFQGSRKLFLREADPLKLVQCLNSRGRNGVSEKAFHDDRSEWPGQSSGPQGRNQRREVTFRKQQERRDHGAARLKNSAPRFSRVGTTRVRSRKSFCCSQEVSA